LIDIQLLNERAQVPTRSTSGAAAFDLYSTEDVLIIPGRSEVVPTGVAMRIPEGWFGLLTHRSSMAFRGDTIASLGIIDHCFTEEIKIKLFNLGADGIYIKIGDKVGEIIFSECFSGGGLNQIK
jgi:dUTP pyrophosphatase